MIRQYKQGLILLDCNHFTKGAQGTGSNTFKYLRERDAIGAGAVDVREAKLSSMGELRTRS